MKNRPQENKIDLKYIFFKLQSKWYWVAGGVILAFLAAYLYLKTTDEIYRVKASMILEKQNARSSGAQELLDAMDLMEKGVKTEDEVGIITSTSTIEKTLEKLDFRVSYYYITNSWLNTFGNLVDKELYNDAPFKVVMDVKSNQMAGIPIHVRIISEDMYEISVDAENVQLYNYEKKEGVGDAVVIKFKKTLVFGEPFSNAYLSINVFRNKNIPLPSKREYYFTINDPAQLIKTYQARVKVKPLERESRIIELTSEGPVKEKEKAFVNAMMESFIEEDLNQKKDIGEKTIGFIEEQLGLVGDSLKKSSVALESFRSTNHIIDIKNTSDNVFEKLDKLETERAITVTNLNYYQNILSYLNNDKDISKAVSPSTMGIDNPILSNLLIELSDLYRQRAGLNYSAKENNPLLKVLELKIDNTKSAIIENLNNIIRSTQQALNYTNQRIGSIDGVINTLPKNERKMVDLQRKFDYNEKMYNYLLEKYAEGSIALATSAPDKKLLDKAKVEGTGPISPKKMQIYLIAILLGCVMPIGCILFLDKLNEKVLTKEQLQSLTRIPVLGMIAHSQQSIKLPLVYNPKSAVAESFRSVRINLQYLFTDMDQKVIGVTSSIGGEGKTFCSINLSADLALSGKRTLLIDADLRKPKIAQYLNLKNDVGLSSYLNRTTDLADSIIPSGVQKLDIMTSGPIPNNSINMLAKPEMEMMLSILKEKYDYIVIDTPPVGYVSDYFILMNFIYTHIYVVRSNYTDKGLISQIDELYNGKKIRNICLVLNDINFSKTYGYKYKADAQKYYTQA